MASMCNEYNVLEIDVLGESRIEIVPSKWYDKAGDKCKWPAVQDSDLDEIIEKCVEPEESWIDCNVIEKASINIASFDSAKRRRDRARDKMKYIESNSERPKRSKQPANKYSPEPPSKKRATTGKSKPTSATVPAIPKPAVKRGLFTTPSDPSVNLLKGPTLVLERVLPGSQPADVTKQKTNKDKENCQSSIRNRVVTLNQSLARRPLTTLDVNAAAPPGSKKTFDVESFVPRNRAHEIVRQNDSFIHSTISSISNDIAISSDQYEALMKSVIASKQAAERAEKATKELALKLDRLLITRSLPTKEEIDLLKKLPFTSRDEIVDFEDQLTKKRALRDEFVEEMARSGGKDAEVLTRNIMKKIFSIELAKKYNRSRPGVDKAGKSKHLLIEHQTLYTLIKVAVHRRYEKAGDDVINDKIRTFFTYAMDRGDSARKKRSPKSGDTNERPAEGTQRQPTPVPDKSGYVQSGSSSEDSVSSSSDDSDDIYEGIESSEEDSLCK